MGSLRPIRKIVLGRYTTTEAIPSGDYEQCGNIAQLSGAPPTCGSIPFAPGTPELAQRAGVKLKTSPPPS